VITFTESTDPPHLWAKTLSYKTRSIPSTQTHWCCPGFQLHMQK